MARVNSAGEAKNGRLERAIGVAAILSPLALIALLAWTPGIGFSEDLGRHLLLGRIILETGAVPKTNYLTYTCPDFPFVNHHWLSEVFFYLAHKGVGLNGLIVWKIATMTLTLALALFAVVPRRGWALYGFIATLAAVSLGFRAHIRPELFTYLFIALYLFLFERARRSKDPFRCWARWAILPVGALWANFHIYFIFGLGMAGAFALERVWANRTARGFWRESAWFFALVVTGVVSPNGLDGLLYPFRIFSNYAINVTENIGPIAHWRTCVNPMLLTLPVLSLAAAAALSVNAVRAIKSGWKNPRLANDIVALTGLIAAWSMARSSPLLALSALPVVAVALDALPETSRAWRRRLAGLGVFAVLGLNVILCAGIVEGWYIRIFPSPIAPTPFGFGDESRYQRLSALAKDYGLKGPVFTDYNLGSLVEYELYPDSGYVDNRPEAFPAEFWNNEYTPALGLGDAWRQVVEKRNVNTVIVSLIGVGERFVRALTQDPNWVLVHLDDLCAVWTRNRPENRTIIEKSRFDRKRLNAYVRSISEDVLRLPDVPWYRRQDALDSLIMRMYGLVCVGEGDKAWPYLYQLYLRYPDYQAAHELLRVTAPRNAPAALTAVFAARARWPLAAKQVQDYALMLSAAGENREALRVIERGLWFFPLSPALRDAREALKAMTDPVTPNKPQR